MQAPEDARPNYHLWHAKCSRLDDGVVCTFDVTAPEMSELAQGDHDVMAAFADALHLGSAQVHSWNVEPFCTPYYAHEPSSDDWRDRLEVAWRVTMQLTGHGNFFDYSGLGPIAAYGLDSTSSMGEIWDGEAMPCVVIIDEGPSREFSFLDQAAPDAVVNVLEYEIPERTLVQARVQLGMLEFPRDDDQVVTLVATCHRQFAATHWADTEQRQIWRESRLP